MLLTYGDGERLRHVIALLNDSAIGNCEWLRKEIGGEPTMVTACDECPLFERPGTTCKHPSGVGRLIAYIAARRPDWCPLDERPLYLKAPPN